VAREKAPEKEEWSLSTEKRLEKGGNKEGA